VEENKESEGNRDKYDKRQKTKKGAAGLGRRVKEEEGGNRELTLFRIKCGEGIGLKGRLV
jgi:hypothetical protein